MRYVGSRLILRLSTDIDEATLTELNQEFADIVVKGDIHRTDPTPSELEDGDAVGLPRLAMHFNRASFSRLRSLIRRINER
jgi:hypothetical protein